LLPEKRQTLFFSATLPPEIRNLADNMLHDPIQVAVTPPCSTVDLIEQSVFFVEKPDKPNLLTYLFRDPGFKRVLIFTRTKHGADKVVKQLGRTHISAEAIHGNKAQNARQRALDAFKHGHIRALVATDIASRGIDVDDVSHVINYDLPNESESYVHRIGRTARAGASGIAIAFCDASEREFLLDIERLIKKRIRHEEAHPYKSFQAAPPPADLEPRRQGSQFKRLQPARQPVSKYRTGSFGGGRRKPSFPNRGIKNK
jgi:ATP-dependent RNA helicase RhlE